MKFGGQPTPWSDEQIDGLRCRTVAQTLIEEIGADGPESAEDAAKRAVTVIQRQRARIAALEAEKAERERQDPVAWAWNDALGCMHVHCGSRRPVWVDGECSDATRAELSLRPLYARPLAIREPTEDECREIWRAIRRTTATDQISGGRAMWQAVREVMTK